MLDTPCVSTPRRSVIVSTSAPSAESSGLSPSFSKICVTVRRNAASETRTWSLRGTLKRSRIMAHSSGGKRSCHGSLPAAPCMVADFLWRQEGQEDTPHDLHGGDGAARYRAAHRVGRLVRRPPAVGLDRSVHRRGLAVMPAATAAALVRTQGLRVP